MYVGQNAVAYASGPQQPLATEQTAGHISQQAEEARVLTETLHKEIESLEQRLSAILRPPASEATSGKEAGNRPVLSAHAEGLMHVNVGLFAAIIRIRGLCARADV